MRISANYTVDDWAALKFTQEADWQLAVEMFHDRLQTRYIDHIDAILLRKTSGFAVLSLDCVLIETLQQFREGTPKTPYNKSKAYFVRFLTGTSFSEHFKNGAAELFYTDIRCGLLHQSEAEGASRIKRGNGRPVVAFTADGKSVIINVHSFHGLLKQVIAEYEQELRQPRSLGARRAFRKKMDYICRIEAREAAEPAAASSGKELEGGVLKEQTEG